MHPSRLLVRSGLTLAAAAALPAALAGPSAAASGISVSTTGSTVSVVTSACSEINGSWGNAALLTSKQANFAQGRQVSLAGTSVSQSAAWRGVSPGTYTVVVVCSSGSTAGNQSVTVSSGSGPTTSSTTSSTSSSTTSSTTSSSASPAPSRGVLGGLGGAARDYGPLTLGIGAALVGTGVIATGWYLRRRSRPYRL
ncbi:hypothetical protein ACFV2N_19620 [Streptomyces sp. NPDC059680]|uniref:hypothetical protein n=1 Tax=Streptomyces TaxID=1883 RepID=UPI001E326877|nr:hypothetical protein [Streptomyces barringtoniae]MCC5477950.1 hypothetical protein [Streptomyces barringtoniae]